MAKEREGCVRKQRNGTKKKEYLLLMLKNVLPNTLFSVCFLQSFSSFSRFHSHESPDTSKSREKNWIAKLFFWIAKAAIKWNSTPSYRPVFFSNNIEKSQSWVAKSQIPVDILIGNASQRLIRFRYWIYDKMQLIKLHFSLCQ